MHHHSLEAFEQATSRAVRVAFTEKGSSIRKLELVRSHTLSKEYAQTEINEEYDHDIPVLVNVPEPKNPTVWVLPSNRSFQIPRDLRQ